METLKNKNVIITGGSGAIGKATAKLFLAEGAKVMLVGRNEDKLKSAIKELKTKNASYCVADVSKMKDTKTYTETALAKFGHIDVFFNNARS